MSDADSQTAEIITRYTAGDAASTIARRLKVDPEVVNRVIDDAGIRRAVGSPPRYSDEQLREWYVGEGWSASEIARRTGMSSSGVTSALHRAGIPIRRGTELTDDMAGDDELTRLYVTERRSDAEIAERFGVAPFAVRRRLRASRIRRPPGSHPGDRPPPPRAELEHLYVDEHRTMAEIATIYGVGHATVRRWFDHHGIARRAAGRDTDPDPERAPFDPASLHHAYVVEGLTTQEIAAEHHVTKAVVLEALHSHRVPMRPGGPSTQAPIVVLDALYADPDVTRVLDRFGIDQRPAGGWLRDRWPTPANLPAEALEALYVAVGLSTFHISLITGHSPTAVRHRLQQAGIVARPAGRSPWRAERSD